MDHFKSIHLKNFGPWKDQVIELHSGVNVIIGESGHGKSALLKAFDFVINNETPKSAQGSLGFITRPEERGKIAEVGLEIYSGENIDKISRRKGKSTNEYQLNDQTPQKAMGKKIPTRIQEIINFKSVNYHKQKDLPFLLDENPGAVAKQLTSIINLEEIDEAESIAKSTLKENKKILDKYNEEKEDFEKEIKQLDFVQAFKAKVDFLKQIQVDFYRESNKFEIVDQILFQIKQIEAEKRSLSDLINLSSRMDQIQKKHTELEAETIKFDKIVEILNVLDEFDAKQERCCLLIALQEKIISVDKKIQKIKSDQIKSGQIKKILDEISDLNKKTSQTKMIADLSSKIAEVEICEKEFLEKTKKYNKIISCVETIESLNQQSKILEIEIFEKESLLSVMECPTCGRKNEIRY